jgi:hypothetical protein
MTQTSLRAEIARLAHFVASTSHVSTTGWAISAQGWEAT